MLKNLFQSSPLAARISYNAALASLTTFRIGGNAEALLRAQDREDVLEAAALCRSQGIPLSVIGGGSNLLLPDAGVGGLVVLLEGLKGHRQAGTTFIVDAGANLSSVIAKTTRSGLGGLEGLAGIPGTIGGALAMNAGGRYGEIGDFVRSATLLLPSGDLRELTREQLNFGYRHSDLRGGIALSVTLELVAGNAQELVAEASRVAKSKLASQPYRIPSAGCIFRNPARELVSHLEGSPGAGRLIDLAGLKGLRRGGASVSTQHANFIVNDGGASASDVLHLISDVKEGVKQKFGIELQTEVKQLAA